MLENETKLTEETAAAMRDLARSVTSAPTLRLAPRPATRQLRGAPPARWRLWAAPLTAMAAVIVLALALVLIRDASHGQPGRPDRPSPAADAGPGSASPTGSPVTSAPVTSAPVTTAPSATGPAGSTAPTTPATTPTNGATANPTASFTFVPMQTADGGEFYSPTGNIECEVDNRAGLVVAMCLTGSPARSVTMDATGHYTTCTGVSCLSNAGDTTPTLAYGTETGVGPFLCESATTGVTCTADGKGFMINTAGITPVTATASG